MYIHSNLPIKTTVGTFQNGHNRQVVLVYSLVYYTCDSVLCGLPTLC